MTVVVGLDPSRANPEALELGAELGAALDRPVQVAVVVVVAPGVPSPLRVGMTDEAFAEQLATDAITEARQVLGDRFGGVIALRERSVRAGLLVATEQPGPATLCSGPRAAGRPARSGSETPPAGS